MNIVKFDPRARNTDEALAVLDQLREEVVTGKIVAFAAIGLDAEDATYGYTAQTRGTTRLRLQGAIAQLFHSFCATEL